MPRPTATTLESLPNIGPATAADLRRVGITAPAQLKPADPYALFDKLCRLTGRRHDPCTLDVFLSAVRYMQGAPAKPWWAYTAERKATLARKRPS